jgi:hypothetical protein
MVRTKPNQIRAAHWCHTSEIKAWYENQRKADDFL